MQRVRFPNKSPFYATLKQRVNDHFEATGRTPRDDWRMYAKTVFILALFGTSYGYLLSGPAHVWQVALAAFVLAQSVVMIGFNVMHDGCHGAYSRRPWVNRWMGRMLEGIGGSHYLWMQKHNVLHHTYTNIESHDDDLASGGLMRFHPEQPHRPIHRFQFLYAPFLYSLLALHWVVSDTQEFFRGEIGGHAIRKPGPKDVAIFLAGKAIFFGWALVVPMLLFAWWKVLLVFVGAQLVVGLSMSLVFQLAHVVDGIGYPEPDPETGNVADDWAIHQLKTTANFAPRNPIVSFYSGGLNHQVEHHLFTKVCHVHYPALSRIVEQTCGEFGVPYQVYPSVVAALSAHFRALAKLGRKAASAA